MKKIKVVRIEPGRHPEVIEIGTKLEELQAAVGGFIETCYAFEDDTVIVFYV